MASGHTEENGHVAADEVTPLLTNSSTSPTADGKEEEEPLPKLQIFFLCFARLVDPISFFCIFPFVNQMIYETGNVNEEDVGFYSGLIVFCSFPNSSRLAHRIL